MKIFAMIVYSVLLYHHVVLTNNDDIICQQAEQYFKQGQCNQALQTYEKIEHKSFPVLYNMSLAYLHQGKRAQALLCGRRAERVGNFSELTKLYDLFYFMKQQINPEYEQGWDEQIAIFIKKCILSFSMLAMQLLLLLMLLILLMIWYFCVNKQNYKQLLSIFFIMSLFSFMMWHYKMKLVEEQSGVVMKNNVAVLIGPDNSFYKKGELQEADEVVIQSKDHGFYRVRNKNIMGWVAMQEIQLVL